MSRVVLRVARFKILYPIVEIKFYASIQRVSEQFPNYSIINSFRRTCRRTGSFKLPATVSDQVRVDLQLRRHVLSTSITQVGIRRRYVCGAGLSGACRRFNCGHDRPFLAGQCRLLRRHLTPPEYRYVIVLSVIRLSNGRPVF